jgi:chloramphenicol 3-O phosphotransferase
MLVLGARGALLGTGADMVHRGVAYDLEVDTTYAELTDCARIIAAHVNSVRTDE